MENIRDVVCRNFNRLVESSGKTKREIAQQMRVSEATLQRWKSGDSFPELPNIEKLALVLGVSTLEFYRAEDPPAAKVEPVSILAKRILNIPDAFFDAVKDLDLGDETAWNGLIGAAEGYSESKKNRKQKAQGKAAGHD